MRILLTGASSFTGSWFAGALADAGYSVTATFRGTPESYEGHRSNRIRLLSGKVDAIWGVTFGDEQFLSLVSTRRFNLLCHHAAEMTDYRSWDFDTLGATAANTRGARQIFERLQAGGCSGAVITGSVFEPFEGIGDDQQRAFNPYGLSKHLSFEILRMEAQRLGLACSKFTIPNPFGPGEESRFTSYLAREWLAGRTPTVATPEYVRDNIHVSLLAQSYVRFIEGLDRPGAPHRAKPSGYIESQGAFTYRMSRELAPRLGVPCAFELGAQSQFPEPMVRVNEQTAAPNHLGWSESRAWDALGAYYQQEFG